MSITLTVLSSLVTIGKTIMDTIKTTKDVFKKDKTQNSIDAEAHLDTLTSGFAVYQKRIELLATQVFQCETLSRFIPMWLVHHNKFNDIQVAPSTEELKILDTELRWFITDSIRDHFSSAFFRTNYDKLPEIERLIKNFRDGINDIDRDLSAIPQGQTNMLQLSWGVTIKADLFRLRRDAMEIEKKANETFEEVVNELRQASTVIN